MTGRPAHRVGQRDAGVGADVLGGTTPAPIQDRQGKKGNDGDED